ncbi:MAG: RNA methyltransferase [Desulfovibrionaceae bacterium]|nr:RNA methyltransferase [Desulfovibrionaceae bacterium]MBF0512589.1 RNA methyltransferase [Desulfovibrionaceae bacterium]
MQNDSDIVTGRKPVLELLQATPSRVGLVDLQQGARGPEVDALLQICRNQRIRFRFLAKPAFVLAHPQARQGVIARVAAKEFSSLAELLDTARNAPLPVILALDQIQDPGNAGALVRTLLALGGGGLIAPKHNTAFLGGGAMRASAGALERLPVTLAVNLGRTLEECAEAGFAVYYAGLGEDSADVFSAALALPAVLALGGEDKGVRPGVAKHCRGGLRIPLPGGFDSLNVAQAGAIILGQFARVRAARG